MKLSKEEVRKIANLAKLVLSEKEEEKFQTQLSGVLSYIDKLNEVDTSKVKPTSQVTGLENVFKQDNVDSSRYVDRSSGKYFETNAVFE